VSLSVEEGGGEMRSQNCGTEEPDPGEKGKLTWLFVPLLVRVVYGEPLERWYLRADILSSGELEDWRGV